MPIRRTMQPEQQQYSTGDVVTKKNVIALTNMVARYIASLPKEQLQNEYLAWKKSVEQHQLNR